MTKPADVSKLPRLARKWPAGQTWANRSLSCAPWGTSEHSLKASTTGLGVHRAPLDLETLHDLGIEPAISRTAKMTTETGPIDANMLMLVAEACWRAVTAG